MRLFFVFFPTLAHYPQHQNPTKHTFLMRFISSLLIGLLIGIVQVVSAQNISNIDFASINVDNLSNQQIQQIYQEAQARGMSISNVVNLAVVRGMPQAEAMKLRRRLQQVSVSGNGLTAPGQRMDSRLRYNPVTDTAGLGLFGQDTTIPGFFGLPPTQARLDYMARRDSLELEEFKLKEKIFGFDLFREGPVSFEPSLNIPTPQNYQLGPGDEIIIDIWGAAANTYQLEIAPDGMIFIENIGPVYLNGLTIEEATVRLKSKLSEIYSGLGESAEQKDTFLQVTLGQIRSIKVVMLGEVNQPGTYTLPSLATLFNALYSAGGSTVQGSFRDIQVIRNGTIAASFDMYEFLIRGEEEDNIRLQDQDIIKISPFINRVEIQGEVKRPGLYELKDDETMQNLINFAGGFTGEAYSHLIKVEGNTGTQKYVKDVPRNRFDEYRLTNVAMVTVGQVLERYENVVEIQGAVFRGGKFELTDSSSVYNLIQRAEGLRGDAFLNRGIILRTQDNFTMEAISFNVRELLNNPEKNDILLKKNDFVKISSIFDLRENYFIEIEGAVQQPQRIPFVENMTLEDLIYQAGGFTFDAAPYRIEVARRIKEVEEGISTSQIAEIFQFNVDEDLQLGTKESAFILKPFDKVYVRKVPNYEIQQDIKIGGQVRFPGTYSLRNRSERISDFIQRAGGLTDEAYVEGAALYRILKTRGTQNPTGENLPQSFIPLNDTTGNTNITLSKIGIDLPRVLNNPGSPYDLLLEKGDSLYIPKELQTVVVKGGVFYPTTVRFEKGRSYRDYITSAGGFTNLAQKKNAYVVYANGDVDRTKKFLFFRNYPEVRPGATIVVPKKEQARKLTPQERVSLLSAIVSTAAVLTSTILSISRN